MFGERESGLVALTTFPLVSLGQTPIQEARLSFAMVVLRVWNALEKEKMMARLRRGKGGPPGGGKCPTLEALPPGWNRIDVRKLNGIRAKYYLAPSGMRYWNFILFRLYLFLQDANAESLVVNLCLFSYTLGAIYFHDFYRYTLLESALQQAKDDAESMLDAEFEDAKEDFADVLEDEEEEFEDAKEEQEEERGTKRKREVVIIFLFFH